MKPEARVDSRYGVLGKPTAVKADPKSRDLHNTSLSLLLTQSPILVWAAPSCSSLKW